jgi:thiol-disulfide isomerase/thioredoxin
MHITIHAQVAKPITISGQVGTDKDSVNLVVWFARDPIVGAGDESKKIQVPVKRDGKFSFTTPPVNHFARLSIHDAFTGNQLFTQTQQFIAPGDEIQFFANIHDQGDPYYFKAVFFGKGAAKYECIQALKAINTSFPHKTSGFEHIIHIYDSLLNGSRKILNNFKGRMSTDEYGLIKADVTGELKMRALISVCGYNFGSWNQHKPESAELATKKQMFDDLIIHFRDSNENENIIPLSVNYRSYLYLKAKTELVLQNNGEGITLKQVCQKLNNEYTGLLREKLLAYPLLNTSENYLFFGGTDPDDYANCLRQAYKISETPEIKTRLKQKLDGFAKGAPAFNFTLPADSSETKKVSMADLKGKVILLDLWAYQCTGCMLFSQAFHKKIYPSFKDNSAFTVVSIMLGESSKAAYMRRLRGEGGAIYTYTDYMNLFGGKGIESGRQLETHLGISAFPTILLIDKQGKIYSSTLPVIYGDPHNKELEKNVNKLTELIKNALAEPGPDK